MDEKEVQAWRDIIMTNTVTVIALVKLLTQKGVLRDEEILKAVEDTKAELGQRKAA